MLLFCVVTFLNINKWFQVVGPYLFVSSIIFTVRSSFPASVEVTIYRKPLHVGVKTLIKLCVYRANFWISVCSHVSDPRVLNKTQFPDDGCPILDGTVMLNPNVFVDSPFPLMVNIPK